MLQLIERLKDENNRQALKLARMLRERYGKRSEKLDPGQLALFLATASAEDAAPSTSEDQKVGDPTPDPDTARLELDELREVNKQARPGRKRTGRNRLPDNLPRETVRLEVAAEQRCCEACGGEKALIGVQTSEILEYVPAHLKVIVYEREKRACRACGDGVVTAPVADKVVEGGRPGPGLLAHLTVSKSGEHTPIHRLARRFEHLGAPIPPSEPDRILRGPPPDLRIIVPCTEADKVGVWVVQAAREAKPVAGPGWNPGDVSTSTFPQTS